MIIAQDKRGTSAVLGKRPEKPTLPFWFHYPGRRCACPGLLSYHPYGISAWLALFEPVARHGQLAEDFLEILGIQQVASLVGQGVTNFLFEQCGCESFKREALRTDNSVLGPFVGAHIKPADRFHR